MKIFLTGGTGFVGSHFINEAHERGYEVIALRRPGALARIQLKKEPTWVDGQLDESHAKHLSGIDVLVHLASHTPNPPYDDLSACLYWNVYASLRLAEQAKECGVTKFVVVGSCFEYGESANHYEKIPVDAPLMPNLSYPTSKASASVAFLGFAVENFLQLQLLRLFQVYGEGEQENRFWPSLHRAAITGKDFPMSLGEQVRDFVYVKDVAKKIVDSLGFKNVLHGRPKTLNIGSGISQTLREFAESWWKTWGGTGELMFGAIPYRNGEIMRLVPQIDDLDEDELKL